MLSKLRRRLSFANVTSLLALFVALGGTTAYAANTVFSTDIVDGEVKTADLANGAVTNGKLKADSVNTGKVINDSLGSSDLGTSSVGTNEVTDDSLTGADILESTLVGVDADTVDGGNLCRTDGNLHVSLGQFVTVCTSGALSVIAACTEASTRVPRARLLLDTSSNDTFVTSGASDDPDLDAADPPATLASVTDTDASAPGAVWSGDTSFAAGAGFGGAAISGSATAEAHQSPLPANPACEFVVSATD
jgi:hypothetical protein